MPTTRLAESGEAVVPSLREPEPTAAAHVMYQYQAPTDVKQTSQAAPDSQPVAKPVEAAHAAMQPVANAAKPQWVRLAFHVSGITLAAFLCRVIEDPLWKGGLCIAALLLALTYEYGRKFPRTRFGRLCNQAQVREIEVGTRAASTDFGIAMAVIATHFSAPVAATAFLVAAYADPIARLWGMHFGRLRWFGGKKTVEGSIAAFSVAACVVFLSGLGLSFWAGLAVAAVAVAAELIPQAVIDTRFGRLLTPCDNFYIPLATALSLAALV